MASSFRIWNSSAGILPRKAHLTSYSRMSSSRWVTTPMWLTRSVRCFFCIVLKEIQPVHSEGDQPWDFFGRNDAKAETLVLSPPHAKSWLIGKDSDAGRDWGQEEKGTRGWDGWIASLTRWTRVWVNSRSWWWTGRPGVLRFMGSQRVGHDWASELNWMCIPATS